MKVEVYYWLLARGGVCAVLLAGIGLAADGFAQPPEGRRSELVVELLATPPSRRQHGYVEYPVRVRNNSDKVAYSISLKTPFRRGYQEPPFITSLSFEGIRVPPQQAATISLLQPPLPLAGEGLEVFVDNRPFTVLSLTPVKNQTGEWSRGYSGDYYRREWLVHPEFFLVSRRIDQMGAVREMESVRRLGWDFFANRGRTTEFGTSEDEDLPTVEEWMQWIAIQGETGQGETGLTGQELLEIGRKLRQDVSRAQTIGWLRSRSASQREFLLQTSDWSDNWLAYSSFDAVVMTAPEWDMLERDVRQALEGYVACGGALFFAGTPQTALPQGISFPEDEPGEHHGLGFGRYGLLSDEEQRFALQLTTNDSLHAPWGWLQNELNRVSGGEYIDRDGDFRYGSYYDYTTTREGFNSIFSVVQDVRVPIVSLMILMVVFAVAAGPANFFLLRWRRRRIWLLWTVPALSLLTCLCIAAFALIAEGVRVRVRSSTATYLDQASGRTSTVGWQAYYSPLTLSSGLHFDSQTEVTPLAPRGERTAGGKTVRLSPGNQHFASGWVVARVPAHFLIRKTEIQQDRKLVVAMSADEDTCRVTNKLGAPIKKLFVVGAESSFVFDTQGKQIAPDASETLRRRSSRVHGPPLDELFMSLWAYPESLSHAFAKQEVFRSVVSAEADLPPGTYVAWLPDDVANPFAGKSLAGKREDGTNVIIGLLEDVPGA